MPIPAPASPTQDAAAEARRKANADALQALSSYLGAERWAKAVQRAERSGMLADDISALAGKMMRTRKAQYPNNERAALTGAANGFLCAVGLVLMKEEVAAFESALAATAV